MIDKRLVAESFSKAASTYDQVAHLQRAVGESLLELLPPDATPATILDLGCGTGFFTRVLHTRYQGAQLVGLDLAEGMLKYACQQVGGPVTWIAGDAERLPLADESVDCIFSSLAIQWCTDLPAVFAEMRRVLRPGGVAVFSTLADGTLAELKTAWRAVDTERHVNDFLPLNLIRDLAGRARFQRADIECRTSVQEYSDLRRLMAELKQLGAHNVHQDRPAGMTGAGKLKRLLQAYEQFRTASGQLPATWQLVFGRLCK